MDNTYTNLSTVTLYKTPMFNETDTTLFASASARDTYFNNIPDTDKIEITDFTPTYEGRQFNLPGNYLDLKKYNTMKLYYNDGLGHTETYYCNVDNYLYVSTNVSTPIYRIDYFLTFGHLLYNKPIDIIVERRTLSNDNINKNMKLDDVSTPRIRYTKHNTSVFEDITNDNSEIGYYVFLNNKSITGSNSAVKGFQVNFLIPVGLDEHDDTIYYPIDSQTIGCYVVYANKSGLEYILKNENNDYIEKIVGVHFPMVQLSVGEDYRFVTYDLNIAVDNVSDNGCTVVYMDNILPLWVNDYLARVYNDKDLPVEDITPSDYKKYDDWNPVKNIVIQGNEFDPKDFDDTYLNKNIDDVVTYLPTYKSGLYIFTILGNTYVYPVGYREKFVNIDYAVIFQSGRNFPYTSDYQNTLAYKQLMEYNAQQEQYAIQNANIQTYYQNQLLANQNAQIDVSKNQNMYSYINQINSLNNQYLQLGLERTGVNANQAAGIGQKLLSGVSNLVSGNYFGIGTNAIDMGILSSSSGLSKQGIGYNRNLINKTINNLTSVLDLQNQAYSLQQQANTINTRFQCDIIALNRDNTLANIAISNKYNNAQPGAYKETDFTHIMSCYYGSEPYVKPYTDYTIINNIKTHYNVYGMYVGYKQTWIPGVYQGHFFDYINGTIINNRNVLSEELNYYIYSQLYSRIQNGIRIWRNDKFNISDSYTRMDKSFGNLDADNTYVVNDSNFIPLLLTISNERRMYLEDCYLRYAMETLKDDYNAITFLDLEGIITTHFSSADYTNAERTYLYSFMTMFVRYEEDYDQTEEYTDYHNYLQLLGGSIGNMDLTYYEKVYTFSKIRKFSINGLCYGFKQLYTNHNS